MGLRPASILACCALLAAPAAGAEPASAPGPAAPAPSGVQSCDALTSFAPPVIRAVGTTESKERKVFVAHVVLTDPQWRNRTPCAPVSLEFEWLGPRGQSGRVSRFCEPGSNSWQCTNVSDDRVTIELDDGSGIAGARHCWRVRAKPLYAAHAVSPYSNELCVPSDD